LPETPSDDQPHRAAARLAWGFALLAAITYALIVLGALVRSHGAGLACPDWPLCFGEFIPRFDLKVAFEWSHRVLAGSVSLVFLGLSIASLRNADTRARIGRLIAVAATLLLIQILLGALTVWQLLASWTVTSHLITGNAFAVALAIIARTLFRARSTPTASEPQAAHETRVGALLAALCVTAALLLLQLVLGGLVSSTYAGLACPDWPTCIDGEWFPSFAGVRGTHLLHRLCAYALVLAIAACAALGRGIPRLGPLLFGALALVLAQVGVGIANVLLRLPVEVTGLHSALAAALVLAISLALDEGWEQRGSS
jgi:cytochrome c oxidase assembly protein subunit 15